MKLFNKKLGFGTLSLLLFAFGSLSMTTFKNGFCLGDSILGSLGLCAWSGGFHLTLLYCLAFFIIAIVFGFTFKSDLGARVGRGLSLIFLSVTGLFLFFVTVFAVINKAAE